MERLYEMVTGRRAFQGKSQLSVASAILEKDPEPINTLQPLTPPALDRTIQVCLAKDPEDRWQTARDLLLELKWIAEASSQAGVPAPVVSHRKLRERLAWMVAAALLIVASLLAAGWWHTVRTSPARVPIRLSAELPRGMIIDRFAGGELAVSPDGTRVVVKEYDTSGKWQLAIRWLDQGQFTSLPGTERGNTPSFSPDGQWIAFFANRKLRKMPVQGGSPVTLCDAPGFPRGASWGDDGNIVTAFNTETSALARVSSAGGAPSQVTQLNKQKGETAHAWPQVLPGSQVVLFTVYRGSIGTADDATIEVVSLKTGERKNLCSGAYFGRYLPTGHLAYLRGNTLFVAPFDLGRMAITGPAQPLLEDVNTSTGGSGDFDFSQTGTLVYVSSQGPSSHYPIFWLDAAQQVKPLQVTPEIYENPLFSPDGKRLAFELATGPMTADIWVKDLERGTMSRLTHLPGRNNHAVWTPDGKAMVFTSYYQPTPGTFWIRADGAGEPQRLTDTRNFQFPSSFSPDGKRLAYSEWSADFSRIEIWTAPVEGSPDHPRLGKAEPFSRTSFSERHAAFSLNGRWLAYSSNESGSYELYVRPFPGPGGKTRVSTGGGGYPIWSRDRHTLFYLDSDLRIMAAEYSAKGDSFILGKPQVWSPKHLAFLGFNYPYDLEPGGKRFAVILDPGGTEKQAESPTDSVNVLLNFFDELRRKVPAGRN